MPFTAWTTHGEITMYCSVGSADMVDDDGVH